MHNFKTSSNQTQNRRSEKQKPPHNDHFFKYLTRSPLLFVSYSKYLTSTYACQGTLILIRYIVSISMHFRSEIKGEITFCSSMVCAQICSLIRRWSKAQREQCFWYYCHSFLCFITTPHRRHTDADC